MYNVTVKSNRKEFQKVIRKNVLLSKMKLFGDTQDTLSDALGISRTRTNEKINEKDGAEFTMSEITIMRNRYRLSPEEVDHIFFSKNDTEKGNSEDEGE